MSDDIKQFWRDEALRERDSLRAELATVRAERDSMRKVVDAAIRYVGPEGEDASELDTAVEEYLKEHR